MERELKFVLPGPEFHGRLMAEFACSAKARLQVNHYFVGEKGEALESGAAMLRLREEEGRFKLAFKGRLEVKDGYFVSDEVEEEVAPAEAEGMLDAGIRPPAAARRPVASAAAVDPSQVFRHAGLSRTMRASVPIPTGDVMEIDGCAYPGGAEDFEVEIETNDPSAAEAFVSALWRRLGIPLVRQTRTKYERFLEAMNRLRGGRAPSSPGRPPS